MQYYPYPPEWFKKTSVDPLTAWDDYRDSLMYWAEDWWDDFFEDELRSVWKMTLYAGSAALILMILLFLETRSSSQPAKSASLEKDTIPQSETSAPVFKEVIKPEPEVVKKPKKAFDPFAAFEPEPEEEITSVPPVKPFPMPKPNPLFNPTVNPPASQPELFTHSVKTDLLPNGQHSEKYVLSTVESHFISPRKENVLLTDGWHRFKPGSQFELSTQEYISWFETPAAQQVKSSVIQADDMTLLNSLEQSSAVIVSKKMPKNVTAGSEVKYELVVKNRSSVIQRNVILEEVVSDHHCVNNVVPAACSHGETLRWVINTLKPNEERHFKITCIASRNSPVLQTETRLQLHYSLASSTIVFVPDVVVALTLPVAVDQSEEFLVQIEISNNSERVFAESDLKIELLQGVLANKSKELIRKVKIPAPGKSIVLPITLTAAQAGTGIIQAELDLEESLMVPVTARTSIRPAKESNESNSRDALVKKVLPQLAKTAEDKAWRSIRITNGKSLRTARKF